MLSTYGLCQAQTTITKAFNDPIIGETVTYYNVNGTIDNSATGNNATFSNTALSQGTVSPTVYSAPSSSELTTYPGSTIKMVASTNTILYKATATKLEITGLITPDAILNFSTNNGTFISYPASFGYTETDTAQGTFTAPSYGVSGNFSGNIAISADAAGTLVIGTTSYPNVLRIKSVQSFNLTVSGFPIGTVTNTAYSYYNSTKKFPILSSTSANINVPALSINQTTNGAQMLGQASLAVASASKKENLTVYPNPAQDFIEFKGNTKNYSKANIYSVDGKLIRVSEINAGKIQISDLPSASYFIEVTGKSAEPKKNIKFIKK